MKIQNLTEEQIKKFPEYVKKWVDIGYSLAPTDFKKSIAAAKKAYRLAGLPEPTLFCGPFNTPIEGSVAFQILKTEMVGKEFRSVEAANAELMERVAKTIKENPAIKVPMPDFGFGSQDYWLSFYDYFLNEVNLDCCKPLQGLIDLSKVCGWWIPLKTVCIFTHRPETIQLDDRGRLHCLTGPAVKFRGEYTKCDVYAVHGVRVTTDIVNKNFSVTDIDNNTNVEVRRVMIEIYGVEKYIIDSHAEIVNSDDFGTLYRKRLERDEDIFMVKVANSTQEPDGSFKDYFIRVDPNAYGGLKSARDAVASTWRNPDGSMVFPDPKQYDPSVQT